MIIYGIPNCDSTQKAIRWLKKKEIDFTFHNYKENGITSAKLNEWSKQVGWEKIFNKKSATWRGLTDEERADIINQKAAVEVMLHGTSIIKRPIVEYNGNIIIGFTEALYEQEFN